MYIYIYTQLEPKWPLFWKVKPFKTKQGRNSDQNKLRVTWVQHRRLGFIFGWLRWLPSWYSHDSYENCWKQEGLLKAFKMDRANWNLKWFPSSYQPCGLKRWLFKVQKVSIHPGRRFSHDNETKTTSWWFQPICKILVQWDHFPR